MSKIEIKECPYCGQPGETNSVEIPHPLDLDIHEYCVKCHECGMRGPIFERNCQKAVEAWNSLPRKTAAA